jgi:predicted GIY-YIG superfamily endonuclease
MATNLPLIGASGVTYNFNVHSKDVTFKALGAVYVITRRYQKQGSITFTHDIIYIGQTKDLSSRFYDHHRETCFNRNNWNCICVHQDANEASRLKKEADLIAAQNPPCNRE